MSEYAYQRDQSAAATAYFTTKAQQTTFAPDLVGLYNKAADFVSKLPTTKIEDVGENYFYSQDGVNGDHGSDGHSGIVSGLSGGDGSSGYQGGRAGNIVLLLASVPESKAFLALHNNTNISTLRMYHNSSISLSARGGQGGNGGDGGSGAAGSHG